MIDRKPHLGGRASRGAFERALSRYGIALVGAGFGFAVALIPETLASLLPGREVSDGLGVVSQLWGTAWLPIIGAVAVLFVAVEPCLPVVRWQRSVAFGVVAVTSLAGLRVLIGALDFEDGRLLLLLAGALGVMFVGAALVPVVVSKITRGSADIWSEAPELGYIAVLCGVGFLVLGWPGLAALGDSVWLFLASLVVLGALSVSAWRCHEGVDEVRSSRCQWLVGVLVLLGVTEAVILVGAGPV